jgi:polyphosphate kinase
MTSEVRSLSHVRKAKRVEATPRAKTGSELDDETGADRSEEPDPGGRGDLERPELLLNREFTWLSFNSRVLHEAEDERRPLLERVKFIAIASSNLDGFVMKRIGGLKQQVVAGIQKLTVDGLTPQQQIRGSYELMREIELKCQQLLQQVTQELREHDIGLASWEELAPHQQKELRDLFYQNVLPLVTPQGTDPAHPFPFISNLSLNLLVELRDPKAAAPSLARVKVPVGAGVSRLLKVPEERVFVPLESVLAHNLDLLFPGMDVISCEFFRVTRNANTERDEDVANDLLAMIETEMRDRKFAPIVRLEVSRGMSVQHRGMLATELGLDEHADVFEIDGMPALRDLTELAEVAEPALHDPPHAPVEHPDLIDDRNVFHTIRSVGSVLVHHPYQSYTTSVERFLREASSDPKVLAVKMTLYRTSEESNAIECLIDAARNGKQVAVVVELKARFDEEANISWANRLEEAGIHVTYGVVGLKTHCKVILVVRQDYDRLRLYAHIGTGDYNAVTARIYSDIGLFTADRGIGQDLTELFNYLTTGYRPKRQYAKILPAPKQCKQALLSKIAREIENHSDDSPGLIQFKSNALEDADVTRALYQASRAGVRVDLIVRDTCRLRPGIPGLSENVRVISIVGRFLEHSRVYYFRNGGDEEYYIGSADCMSRNLESRVEILVPVEAPELRKNLRFFLDTQLTDPCSAWEMQSDGSYVQRRPEPGEAAEPCQQTFIDRANREFKQATRLRRRKPRGVGRRNTR